MAITQETKTVVVQTEVRTTRVTIDCPRNAAPVARFDRQEVKTVEGEGVLNDRVVASVNRTIAGPVLAEVATLASGKVLTVAEIAEAISLLGDKWHAADIAAAEAAAARLAEVKAAKEEPAPVEPEPEPAP